MVGHHIGAIPEETIQRVREICTYWDSPEGCRYGQGCTWFHSFEVPQQDAPLSSNMNTMAVEHGRSHGTGCNNPRAGNSTREDAVGNSKPLQQNPKRQSSNTSRSRSATRKRRRVTNRQGNPLMGDFYRPEYGGDTTRQIRLGHQTGHRNARPRDDAGPPGRDTVPVGHDSNQSTRNQGDHRNPGNARRPGEHRSTSGLGFGEPSSAHVNRHPMPTNDSGRRREVMDLNAQITDLESILEEANARIRDYEDRLELANAYIRDMQEPVREDGEGQPNDEDHHEFEDLRKTKERCDAKVDERAQGKLREKSSIGIRKACVVWRTSKKVNQYFSRQHKALKGQKPSSPDFKRWAERLDIGGEDLSLVKNKFEYLKKQNVIPMEGNDDEDSGDEGEEEKEEEENDDDPQDEEYDGDGENESTSGKDTDAMEVD